MGSSRDILKTPREEPPRGRGGWGKFILLLAVFVVVLAALVYFFVSSLKRVNQQAVRAGGARLSGQVGARSENHFHQGIRQVGPARAGGFARGARQKPAGRNRHRGFHHPACQLYPPYHFRRLNWAAGGSVRSGRRCKTEVAPKCSEANSGVPGKTADLRSSQYSCGCGAMAAENGGTPRALF